MTQAIGIGAAERGDELGQTLEPYQRTEVGGMSAGLTPSLAFVAATGLALGLAAWLPLATTVLGLILFGLIHNFFELRYLYGRFGTALGWPLVTALLALITLIAGARLLPTGAWGPTIEIVVGYAVLGVLFLWTARSRPWLLLGGLASVTTAAMLSLAQPETHFVVISHLHNVVPLFFLWEWSRDLPNRRARLLFRSSQIGWAIVVPTLILTGGLGVVVAPNLAAGAGLGPSLEGALAGYTPPAWRDSHLTLRFLTLFAFLQLMHYFVWCAFMPRVARREVDRFERALERTGVPDARFVTVGAVGCAVALGAVFVADYSLGRTLYGVLASYHAYLEYPIIAFFAFGLMRPSAGGSR